jgi:hypothetical protein
MRTKPAKHSKTMWFSLLLVIFGALFDNWSVLQGMIDPRFYSFSLVIIGLITAILRFFTTKPIE